MKIAADVAEGEQTLHDATSPQGLAGGLNKRRSSSHRRFRMRLSIVKGLVAHPDTAFTPVTKGILVGGTAFWAIWRLSNATFPLLVSNLPNLHLQF